MIRKQFHLIIQGDVVGVGYRSWLRGEAKKLAITGWVRNREDRTVEAIVQGEEKRIQQIIQSCEKGPEVAWVEKMRVTEKPISKDLLSFEVVY